MPMTTHIDSNSTFTEIDEALHQYEAPFYEACARGGFFQATVEWKNERARLTALWIAKCPYKQTPKPDEETTPNWFQQLYDMFSFA